MLVAHVRAKGDQHLEFCEVNIHQWNQEGCCTWYWVATAAFARTGDTSDTGTFENSDFCQCGSVLKPDRSHEVCLPIQSPAC